MEEEKMIFESCDKNIPCKECKWAQLVGYLKSNCIKYERKPYEVYYQGENCPRFVKKEG